MTNIAQPVASNPFEAPDECADGAAPSSRFAVTTIPSYGASCCGSQPTRHHQSLFRTPVAVATPFQIPSSSSEVHSALLPYQKRPSSLASYGAGGMKAAS